MERLETREHRWFSFARATPGSVCLVGASDRQIAGVIDHCAACAGIEQGARPFGERRALPHALLACVLVDEHATFDTRAAAVADYLRR